MTRQYISEATGFDAGDEFTDAEAVRVYFTRENLVLMFDECPYSEAELEDMAETVIDHRWHCAFATRSTPYHYESIAPHEVRALDLRREIVALETTGTAFECARVHIDGQAEAAEIVFVPEAGRLGCAWGADADWADTTSVDEYLARAFGEETPL